VEVAFPYLLSTIGGQIEGEHREKGDAHTRNDDVDRVEEGFPSHGDVERNVQVGLITARVELLIPVGK
jgi:hypothetical protein